ncbi:receptor-like protein EIX1 [Humulus lupulus]|uniref:receptor-like protein EIX1 n=1 Tax=Humulus lupulus TaxID=3486 RepID=UPI002B410D82|nr:receptor-like protein EIX1 [Humulus lupulus]
MIILVVWLLFLLTTAAHVRCDDGDGGSQCIEKEKEALLSFKRVADPGNLLSWATNSSNQNCCNWEEITCDDQTNHVVAIDYDNYIYGKELGGEIGCSLAELHYLNYLSLSFNDFTRIPKCIGSFKLLTHLDLSYNPISGAIPPEFGNLTKLQDLHLSYNDSIYVDSLEWLSRLTSLKTFALYEANFTKAGLESFRVPPFLSDLDLSDCLLPKVDLSSLSPSNYSSNFLKTLTLDGNSIHPTAITWFLNSSNNLFELTMSVNIIDGLFPDSIRGQKSLSEVYLTGNKAELENGVLKSLGNLSNMQILDLSYNNLSGTLHNVLENLAGSAKNSLETLYLDDNQLSGSILEDAENTFPSLKVLDLANNRLEGTFPSHLGRFPSLETLRLYDNQLTGPLPDLSSMLNLTYFYASNNRFNGTSTESIIGGLSHLEYLEVSSNSLVGVISEVDLIKYPKLESLSFSYNSALRLKFNSNWVPPFQLQTIELASCKLGPQFPSWLQTQSQLSRLDISDNDISSVVPNWFSNISSGLRHLNMSFNLLYSTLPHFPLIGAQITVVDLSFNKFHGSIPSSLSNASNLNLSHNNFTSCSSFLCEAKDAATEFLDMSNNQLFGSLPDCWGNFNSSLYFLKLDYNDFSREIPSSIGSLTNIQSLQLGNNNFSGALPSTLENCINLQALDFGWNSLEGTIPSWIGERFASLISPQMV